MLIGHKLVFYASGLMHQNLGHISSVRKIWLHQGTISIDLKITEMFVSDEVYGNRNVWTLTSRTRLENDRVGKLIERKGLFWDLPQWPKIQTSSSENPLLNLIFQSILNHLSKSTESVFKQTDTFGRLR